MLYLILSFLSLIKYLAKDITLFLQPRLFKIITVPLSINKDPLRSLIVGTWFYLAGTTQFQSGGTQTQSGESKNIPLGRSRLGYSFLLLHSISQWE